MAKSFWIGAADVEDNTVLQGSIDDNKLRPFIEEAQDIDIQNLLGSNLYNKIDTLIDDEEISNSDNSKYFNFLKDYIKPALQQAAGARFIEQGGFEVDNRGIYVPTSSKGTAASRQERLMLADRLWRRYELYANKAYLFLCSGNSDITEYYTTNSGDIPPSYEPYTYTWSSI